jgi:hypothetical protein
MKLVQLIFKKVGNHWYLDIEHNNPQDLILDPILERFLSLRDSLNLGIVDNIYLVEQSGFIEPDGLLQFTDEDLLRYFTTKDIFKMNIFISNHHFQISSNLYSLLENKYQLDFHISAYRLAVY